MCGEEVPLAVTPEEGPAFLCAVFMLCPWALTRVYHFFGPLTYGLQIGYEPNTLSILHWAARLSNTAATLASCR